MTLQTKIEQALALAEQHKLCSESLHMQNLVGEIVDVPALAKALGVAIAELENLTKTDVCDVGRDSFIWLTGWRNDAKASAARRLAEITKILLPKEKV